MFLGEPRFRKRKPGGFGRELEAAELTAGELLAQLGERRRSLSKASAEKAAPQEVVRRASEVQVGLRAQAGFFEGRCSLGSWVFCSRLFPLGFPRGSSRRRGSLGVCFSPNAKV